MDLSHKLSKIINKKNYNRKIRKNQIDLFWSYTKTETEINCKKYIQIFILFFSTGFAILINNIFKFFYFYYVIDIILLTIGVELLLISLWSIIKIKELTNVLKEQMSNYQIELERLKYY